MSLRKVQAQNWARGDFAYAPPVEEALVNTAEIASAVTTDSRGEGPWTLVTLRNGKTLTCQGTPITFLGEEVSS